MSVPPQENESPIGLRLRVPTAIATRARAVERTVDELTISTRTAAVTVFATSTLFAISIMIATGGGFPFELDGLRVVTARLPATWETLLTPFHTHLNLIPIAIWDRLAVWFGTSSTTPYMVLLLGTHIVLATATTALLARRIGPAYALAIGLPLGMLGSAHYNYLAPWQVLFTITLLAGLVAVWASIARRRTPLSRLTVVVALLVGVMSSNATLFVILAMWLWLATDGRPRQVLETLPALILFALWFVTYGIGGLGSDGNPLAVRAILLLVPYTLIGIASGAGGAVGLGPLAGAFVLGILAVRFRPPAPLTAFLVAIVAMFMVAALFRYMSGAEQASTSRYVMLAVYMAAFGLAAAGVRPTIPQARALAIGVVAAAFNLVTFAIALRRYP
jgi:hypothetical protein